jgi:hypothetical protein
MKGFYLFVVYTEQKTNVRQICKFCLLLDSAAILLCLFFDLENRGDMFIRNISWQSMYYTTLRPRRQNSLYST